MIFDLLTSPQGHQFDPRVKINLHSVLLITPDKIKVDMPFDHVQIFFDPLGIPKHPQVPPLGHDPGDRTKFCSICFISFICEDTLKVWYKNL